jgi:hypothetical protein
MNNRAVGWVEHRETQLPDVGQCWVSLHSTQPPKRDGVCNPVPNVFAMSELNGHI